MLKKLYGMIARGTYEADRRVRKAIKSGRSTVDLSDLRVTTGMLSIKFNGDDGLLRTTTDLQMDFVKGEHIDSPYGRDSRVIKIENIRIEKGSWERERKDREDNEKAIRAAYDRGEPWAQDMY